MTAFVVITPSPEIRAAIVREYPNDHFRYTDNEWFVADEGVTAQEVHRKLATSGSSGEIAKHTVIVCAVAGYYGVAQKNLWEWLTAKGNASRHGIA